MCPGPRAVARIAAVAAIFGLPGAAAGQVANVSTMAQLRSAISNSSISTININPGNYVLTTSGSGELNINRNLTIQNTGGGRVVIDANNASRVFKVEGGNVTFRGLTISGGRDDKGGGMEVEGTVSIIECTISGNTATEGGGGIRVRGGTLSMTNSTVSGNSAGSGRGGGIWAESGTTILTHVTITGNSAGSGQGGGIRRESATTLRNTIVAGNTGGQIVGTITSQGRNLVQGGCSGCTGADITSDPLLGPLTGNGGNSFTHALLFGSPAVNVASSTYAQATDQRGVTRPQGSASDIGAFETGTDIGVGKTVDRPAPFTGDTVVFTVTVNSAGPDGATSVLISDPVPAGVTLVSATPSRGTYNSSTGAWTVGTLAAGASATLVLRVRVNSGTGGSTITNTASVTSLYEAEYVSTNNSANAAITVQIRLGVTVTPDGGQLLRRLPSNTVSYTFRFTVVNTSDAAMTFDLLASRAAAVIAITSVNGVAGDSTRITNVAASASVFIDVVFTVASVAAGAADTLRLRARSVGGTVVSDDGFADLVVVRPGIAAGKTVVPAGTVLPGTELTYTINVSNGGTEAAVNTVVVDSLPPATDFKVGSPSHSLPGGMGVTVSYSSNGGLTWTYVPSSGGCGAPAGFDRCVNRIRWALASNLAWAAPDNAGWVRFVARIH